MRVAHIAPWFIQRYGFRINSKSSFGGAERFIFNLCKFLSLKGLDIEIITSLYKGKGKSNFNAKILHRDKNKLFLELNPHFRVNYLRPKIFFDDPYFPVYTPLKEISPDIIHCQSYYTFITIQGIKFAKKHGLPVFVHYHGGSPKSFLRELWDKFYLSHYLKKIDALITPSHSTWDYFIKELSLDPNKFVIIPNCVDTDRFRPLNSDHIKEKFGFEDKTILMVISRLLRSKGIDILIKAFDSLTKKYNDLLLLIGGCGPYEKNLKNLVKSLNISDRVKFLGFVPDDKLVEYYNLADIFILPSLGTYGKKKFYSEAFGIVLIEAMACGIPVITADVPGCNEVVKNGINGLLAHPDSPEDLAEKIEMYLNDTQLIKKYGKKAREDVIENYSWDVIVTKMVNLYNNCLTNRI
jgi:glycosyltransferase involved in cell wall biosynthesis